MCKIYLLDGNFPWKMYETERCMFEHKWNAANPLNVKLHVLLGAAFNLLLHFPHWRLHIDNALLRDADGNSSKVNNS